MVNNQIKKASSIILSFAIVIASLSVLTLNFNKFILTSSALTKEQQAEFWNYYDEENSIYPYVDFTPFEDSTAKKYQINSAEQMAALSVIVNADVGQETILIAENGSYAYKNNFSGKTVELNKDIDLSSHKWVPIGYSDKFIFQGNFIGRNMSIRNLNTSSYSEVYYKYVGLFGFVKGNLDHINLLNSTIYSKDAIYVGTVAGYCIGNVTNCGSSMTCSNDQNKIISEITCSNYNHISIGGTVGRIVNGNIESCGNSSTIITQGKLANAQAYIGGVVGHATNSNINQCTNSKDLTPQVATYVGGIVGYCDYTLNMKSCNNLASVSPINSHVGGIIGGAYECDINLDKCSLKTPITERTIKTNLVNANQVYYCGLIIGKYEGDMSRAKIIGCSLFSTSQMNQIGNQVNN